ncbi:unnamed protein product [Ectocarpus sp. 12 AP-2014]
MWRREGRKPVKTAVLLLVRHPSASRVNVWGVFLEGLWLQARHNLCLFAVSRGGCEVVPLTPTECEGARRFGVVKLMYLTFPCQFGPSNLPREDSCYIRVLCVIIPLIS